MNEELNSIEFGNQRFLKMETKSLNAQNGAYALPPAWIEYVASKLNNLSQIRQHSRVTMIASDGLEVLLDSKDADAGWGMDSKETQASELKKLRIPLHTLYAKPKVSQQLIDDSQLELEQWLGEKIAEKMAMLENHSFLFGDGEKQPKGILTYPREVNQQEWGKIEVLVADKLTAESLIDLLSLLEPKYLSNARWIMSRKMQAMVRKLKDPTTGSFLWQPGLHDGIQTILGHPVTIIDDLAEASEVSLILADLKSGYQVVDRSPQLQLLRDPYSSKPYVEFYANKRVGGDIIDFKAFKVLQCKG